jgi:putative inorganic carbon (hco3(-)) transporter
VGLLGISLLALLGSTYAFGRRQIIMIVLLTRCIADPIFDLTKFAGVDGGGDIGIGAALNVLVIAVAFTYFIERPREIGSLVAPMWAPFLLVSFASLYGTPDPAAAVRFFLVQVSYCAVFAIPYSIIRSDEDFYECLMVVLLSSIVPVLYGFFELLSGGGMTEEGLRLQSTFNHPNIFAFYLTVVIAVALFLTKSKALAVPFGLKRFISLYFPVLLILLMLTKTRSAWLACGVLLFVYSISINRRFLLYVLVLPAIFLLEPSLRERLFDLETGNVYEDYAKLNSYAWRELLWQSAMDWIVQKPILGHGLTSFIYYVDQFFPLQIDENNVPHAHSVYVELLFEEGVLGLISFLWLFFKLMTKLLNGFMRESYGITILITSAIAYLVESYSDNMAHYLSFDWYFWFVMGATCAWLETRKTQDANRRLIELADGIRK